MILPDANLLIFATDASSPYHGRALAWWEGALNGDETIALPWAVALAFLRLTTKRVAMASALEPATALRIVQGYYASPRVVALEPGPRHLDLLAGLLREAGTAGNLVPDAHLAALAIEHRATLCSHDGDFRRFSGFALFDPLG